MSYTGFANLYGYMVSLLQDLPPDLNRGDFLDHRILEVDFLPSILRSIAA